LEDGSIDKVATLLKDTVEGGLHQRFHHVMAKKNFKSDDVTAGREFVATYVTYIHYVEGVHNAAKGSAREPHAEAVGATEHQH
jgi:hypothetical protein